MEVRFQLHAPVDFSRWEGIPVPIKEKAVSLGMNPTLIICSRWLRDQIYSKYVEKFWRHGENSHFIVRNLVMKTRFLPHAYWAYFSEFDVMNASYDLDTSGS